MQRNKHPHGFIVQSFYGKRKKTWPKQNSYDLCEEDPEVKDSLKMNLTSSRTTTLDRLERISFWSKRKQVNAIML